MMTLKQLLAAFPTEDSCREYLFWHRWPDGKPHCPRCGKSETVYNINQPWKWECSNPDCRTGHAYRFSLLVGTIFENTKYPLRTWFEVLWSMLNAKKGISSMQVQRQIGSSYPTALYMTHRLRAAMHDPEFRKLMGIVEIDEMYHGGKAQNMHAKKRKSLNLTGTKHKIAIIGAISRKGNIICQMIENTDTATLDSFVRRAVSEKVDLIATDEHSGYRLLGDALPHQVVRHSAGEYVRGVVHTNSIESFWALFKRGVVGTYHNVSKKYLPLYLAEFQFRHNNRKNPDIFGAAVAGSGA